MAVCHGSTRQGSKNPLITVPRMNHNVPNVGIRETFHIRMNYESRWFYHCRAIVKALYMTLARLLLLMTWLYLLVWLTGLPSVYTRLIYAQRWLKRSSRPNRAFSFCSMPLFYSTQVGA